jgi:hypothetical protein
MHTTRNNRHFESNTCFRHSQTKADSKASASTTYSAHLALDWGPALTEQKTHESAQTLVGLTSNTLVPLSTTPKAKVPTCGTPGPTVYMGRPPTAASPTGSFNLSRAGRLEYTQIETLIKDY